ncbi:hypothetical protein GH714_035462 [Hevea brasiliensis]|uniref:Protein kinase domain-containing protein n=1 Tax=Hevea brasiliensis TaxID=3981 RepID=A0A6A6NCI4_HEVBR|nr:hypothetical protein GH714_035462 [Hevea brasiliensis]
MIACFRPKKDRKTVEEASLMINGRMLLESSVAFNNGRGHFHVEQGLCRENVLKQILGFLAPEHFLKSFINGRVDIYSFGVVLLSLLTGKRVQNPFPSASPGNYSLVQVVKKYMETQKFNEIVVDLAVLEEGPWPGKEQQLQNFPMLALQCTCDLEDNRPEIIDVAKQLRQMLKSLCPLHYDYARTDEQPSVDAGICASDQSFAAHAFIPLLVGFALQLMLSFLFWKFQGAMQIVAMAETVIYINVDTSSENYWLRLLVKEWAQFCILIYIGYVLKTNYVTRLAPRFFVMPTIKSEGDIMVPPVYSIEMDATTFKDFNCNEWHIGVEFLAGGAFGGNRGLRPVPPEKGVFLLDHMHECDLEKKDYLNCLRSSGHQSENCRHFSKKYLECRMEKNLMARQDMSELGFEKVTDLEASGEKQQ